MSETPVQIVHRHVEAMSSRDVDGFLADCAETIRLLNPSGETLLEGKPAIRSMYASVFAANPDLKVELMDRISIGNWVIDEHLTTGFADGSLVHVARVYHVADDLIQSIQVFSE